MPGNRLLIIEDDPDIVTIISKIAGDMGFEVRSAHGQAVKQVYKQMQPGIIVLDIMMPDMDGLEVIQFLRDQGSESHIILLSGSQESYRRIAQNMGMGGGLMIDANVSKPFRTADLRLVLERVSRAIGSRKQQRATATA